MNNKIWRSYEYKELTTELSIWHGYGQNLVITGLFGNPIHLGHLQLLRGAASLGDMLVVAVNDDEASTRKSGHSFMPIEDRLEIIAEFSCVDFVVENKYDSMTAILGFCRPQIYAKGGDKHGGNMLMGELDKCMEIGCRIVYGVGGGKIRSSSELIQRARGLS